MIADAKRGKINTIIAKDLSRLGRNLSEMINYLDNIFPSYNIRFIAINDNFDTNTYEAGDMNFVLKSMFNEQYAKDIGNKVKASINTKKRNGQFLGGIPPYGYKKSIEDKYKLEIDESTALIVRRIFNMFISGSTIGSICRTLTDEGIPIPSVSKNLNRGLKSLAYGEWHPRTVSEILNNPTYIGNLTQCRRKKLNYKSKKIVRTPKEDWIIVENTHEPIIDKDTFNIAQSLLERKYTRNNNDVLLKGFIYCKECGHTISIGRRSKDSDDYYCGCNFYKKHSKSKVCTPHSFKYNPFEEEILKKIRKICKECIKKERLLELAKNDSKRIQRISYLEQLIRHSKRLIKQYNDNIDKAYIDKLNNVIPPEQYQRINENFIKKIETEKELIKSYEKELNSIIENKPLDEDYIKIINDFLALKKPNRVLIASLIDKIEVDEDKNVYIHFKINNTNVSL